MARRGYIEALDEFMVVSNLVQDLALFSRREDQMILRIGFHRANFDSNYGLKQD
jgi:hypothetical protein